MPPLWIRLVPASDGPKVVSELQVGVLGSPEGESRQTDPGTRQDVAMARYRKIDPRIWNDAKVRDMSERGKLVFLYVLTHPAMTMIGAMRASVPGLAAELPCPEKAFREAFLEALAKGILKHDASASMCWAPKFLHFNPPESPNVVRAWPDALQLIPECDLKDQLFLSLKGYTEGYTEGFRIAFKEAFAKGIPIQEQEQEQEQEQDKQTASRRGGPKPVEVIENGILIFPTVGTNAHQWPLTQAQLNEWTALYPGLDIIAECRKALAWVQANKRHRKTPQGMPTFLVAWLNRSTDTARPSPGSQFSKTAGNKAAASAFLEGRLDD